MSQPPKRQSFKVRVENSFDPPIVRKGSKWSLLVRDRLQAFGDMVKRTAGNAATLEVARLNTTPARNANESIEKITTEKIADIEAVLADFASIETVLNALDALPDDGEAITRAWELVSPMNTGSPRPQSDDETFSKCVECIRTRLAVTCMVARKHMAYTDYLWYDDLQLLLEGLTIEALMVILTEAKRLEATGTAELIQKALATHSDLDYLSATAVSYNGTTGTYTFDHVFGINMRKELAKSPSARNADLVLGDICSILCDSRPEDFDDLGLPPPAPHAAELAIARLFTHRTQMLIEVYKKKIATGGASLEGASNSGKQRKEFDHAILRQEIEAELANRRKVKGKRFGDLGVVRHSVAKNHGCGFRTVETASRGIK